MKQVSWLIILCYLCNKVEAQYSIELQKPAIIALKTADLWNCVVQNAGNGPIEVYLQGSITEKSRGKVYEVRSGNFLLKQGVTIYNTANYADLKGEKTLISDKIFEDHIVRTNTLPNGSYTFCAAIYNGKSNQKLADDCIQFSINNVTPPLLITPLNNGIVCEQYPTFVWERQRGQLLDSRLTYNLKIVELLKGQTTVAAMKSNPCFYCETNIKEPLHQFSFKGIPFEHGKKYAWGITVVESKKAIANSEFWIFEWQKCGGNLPDHVEEEEEDIEEEEEVKNEKRKGLNYYFLSGYTHNNENIIVTNQKLNFYIINNSESKNMNITMSDGKSMIYNKESKISYGENYFDIDLQSLKLAPNNLYKLRIIFDNGEQKFLNFKTL